LKFVTSLARMSFDEDEDDLYKGYNNQWDPPTQAGAYSNFDDPAPQPAGGFYGTGFGGGTSFQGNAASAAAGVLHAQQAAARQGTSARRTLNSQMGRAGAPEENRPMTSVRAAGYSSAGPKGPRPLSDVQQSKGPAPPLAKKSDGSPEDQAREMEKKVNTLLEESAIANSERKYQLALEKAKEAAKKERALCKHRETNGLLDQINLDLTYSVCFNLANQYHANEMYTEALNTYSIIVKNKQYAQSGRLRVNMGNIYYKQRNYPAAIKMYRMALDQIPQTGREIRFKIMRNIGNAFTRLGQYQDAIGSFESIMEGCPDLQTGFNLVVCYYALGDRERTKKGFARLLSVRTGGMEEEEPDDDPESTVPDDDLKLAQKKRRKVAMKYVTTAAKLISPMIEKDFVSGFDYVIEQLRLSGLTDIASEMEISKAVFFLKQRNVEKAKETLVAFERKEDLVHDTTTRARAATNLSFLYFLEGDHKNADKYGTMAIKADRYNAKALVNKGNCEFRKGMDANEKGKLDEGREYFTKAKELYYEAIGVEADCTESIYNLCLVKRAMGLDSEALSLFEKLQKILPQSAEVLYQIASLHAQMGNVRAATQWYKLLISHVPSDAGVLAHYGVLLSRDDDETQAYHYHHESYRYYPVDMEVISWLGAYFVKSEMYEKAMAFFIRASQIQPKEVKWRLMVASCYRRIGSFQQALRIYQDIEKEYPDNIECLNYLVRICTELGMNSKLEEYANRLAKAERKQDKLNKIMPTNAPPMREQSPEVDHRQDAGPMLDASAAVAAVAGGGDKGKGKVFKKQVQNDDDWGEGDDVADLLPE